MRIIKICFLMLLLSVAAQAELIGSFSYNELQKLADGESVGGVAFNNDMAVVGIPDVDNNAVVSAGAVLVYVYNAESALYEFTKRIDAPTPLENDNFGDFVALNNNSIIIRNRGQYYYDFATSTYTISPRSIFVYEYHTPTDIRLISRFNTPDTCDKGFTCNIYVEGDRFMAVSYNGVYIYQKNASTGMYELKGDRLPMYSYSTNTFKIKGDYIFIGDPNDSSTDKSNAGAVHVYKFNQTTENYDEVDILRASDAMTGDGFGATLVVNGNTLIVGATGNSYYGIYATLKSSAVYIFDLNNNTEHFEETDKLLSAPNITSYSDAYRDFNLENNTFVLHINDELRIYTRVNNSEKFKISQILLYPTSSYPSYKLNENTLLVKVSDELKIYERENESSAFILKNTIIDSNGYYFSYIGSTKYKMFIKVSDGISVSGTNTYIKQESFIERFYQNILGRAADSSGLATWLNAIQTQSAATVAEGFFNSAEFTNLGLNDEDFINILYKTLFDRDADAGGKSDWLTQLSAGKSRDDVVQGFLHAQEFKNLADSFGVSATSVGRFVNRFYELVLGREADEAGFNDWTSQLNSKTKGGGDIAKGFFNSTEYTQRGLSDSDFLDICYRAFFDREADTDGKSNWLTLLSEGSTKNEVLDGFINSQEFSNLTALYGIIP